MPTFDAFKSDKIIKMVNVTNIICKKKEKSWWDQLQIFFKNFVNESIESKKNLDTLVGLWGIAVI